MNVAWTDSRMAMRLYWPKAEALEGKWVAPPLKRMP